MANYYNSKIMNFVVKSGRPLVYKGHSLIKYVKRGNLFLSTHLKKKGLEDVFLLVRYSYLEYSYIRGSTVDGFGALDISIAIGVSALTFREISAAMTTTRESEVWYKGTRASEEP